MRHASLLRINTKVATGSGEGPERDVAEGLIDQWLTGGPFFMSVNAEGGDSIVVAGQVGTTTEETRLEVERVVLSRSE